MTGVYWGYECDVCVVSFRGNLKQLTAGECIVGSCIFSRAYWMFLGGLIGIGDIRV